MCVLFVDQSFAVGDRLRHRILGPAAEASPPKTADPGFGSRCVLGDLSGPSHSSDFKTGPPVAVLPDLSGPSHSSDFKTGPPVANLPDLSGPSHSNDFKTGPPVANLPGAWRYRVRDGSSRAGVSILVGIESLFGNLHVSVAARTTVCEDPSLRYTSVLLGR